MKRSPRLLLAILGVTLLLIGLAACGDDDDGRSGDAATSTESSDGDDSRGAGGDAEDGAFPVVIEHKYGETTVDAEPERVVSVGFTDQDFLLSLGVVPVGIRDWYGDQPFATWPWAQDALGDAEPEVLPSAELNFEQIAALQPDLIVGVSSGMTEEDYTTLSAIAPTVTQGDEYVDYGTPWQVGLAQIGAAVGKTATAADLIDDIEGRFAEISESHPDFTGDVAVAYVVSADEIGAYASSDTRSRMFTDLGFSIPAEYDEIAGDLFYANFSLEEIERIDRELLVWIGVDPSVFDAIREHPLHDSLDVVARGAEVFMSPEHAAAAGFSSPLALTYLLDEFVPILEAATDDDPATEVPVP